ncbi:MAG: hypothetical protein AAF990_09210 [Bacteroidota bacterium]
MENGSPQSAKTKVMIIVWKWKELTDRMDLVYVEGTESDEERHKVIRVNMTDSEKVKMLLLDLADQYKESDVFIFLHRSHPHNFTDDFIEDLTSIVLDRQQENQLIKNKFKCFLIGGGQDYIYFCTKEEGILDEVGYFMDDPEYELMVKDEFGKEKKLQEGVAVVTRKFHRLEVKRVYFNQVWYYYSTEFKKKLEALHIDLMSHLVDLENSNGSANLRSKDILAKLEQEEQQADSKLLRIRIRSLLNVYDLHEMDLLPINQYELREEEKDKLIKKEKESKNSYLMDDCAVYLSASRQAEQQYKKLSRYLKKMFVVPTNGQLQEQSLIELRRINQLFRSLIMSVK